jgi:hypothetical protein
MTLRGGGVPERGSLWERATSDVVSFRSSTIATRTGKVDRPLPRMLARRIDELGDRGAAGFARDDRWRGSLGVHGGITAAGAEHLQASLPPAPTEPKCGDRWTDRCYVFAGIELSFKFRAVEGALLAAARLALSCWTMQGDDEGLAHAEAL